MTVGLILALGALVFTVSNFRKQRQKHSTLDDCRWNLQRICSSLDEYATEHGGTYPWDGNVHGFLSRQIKTKITCPMTGRESYRIAFDHFVPEPGEPLGSRYTLWCSGLNHQASGVPKDYPRTKGFGRPVEP